MVKAKFDLPGAKGATYYDNGGYVELEDRSGVSQTFLPNAMMLYKCSGCEFYMYASSNYGDIKCPCCSSDLEKQWRQLQVLFTPEQETEFSLENKSLSK